MKAEYSLLLQKYQELEEQKWYLLGQNERLVKELEQAIETSEDKANADTETIKSLKDENAALRASLDSLRTKIADAAKGDCRKLHEFERIALAMKEAQS